MTTGEERSGAISYPFTRIFHLSKYNSTTYAICTDILRRGDAVRHTKRMMLTLAEANALGVPVVGYIKVCYNIYRTIYI